MYSNKLLDAEIDFENNRIYFWGGIFSQWSKCIIYDVIYNKKIIANCAEQLMMLRKAELFDDKEVFDKILKTTNPRDQKKLGRIIKNYDDALWTENRFEIVEASPFDKIWGIGLAPDDSDVTDSSKWKGQNLLGKAIMQARKEIFSDSLSFIG